MAMPVRGRVLTAEEFERLPEEPGVRMELVRGRVVRMSPAGYEHGDIGTRILLLLAAHVNREGLGKVLMPTGFRIETNPDTVREPDAAFISRERLLKAGSPGGFFQGAPDLAVEVLSPSDRRRSVQGKVAQYLQTGVRMVWLVEPESETVTVHQPFAEPLTLSDGDVLDGADVIPGFRCEIREIFR